MSEAPQMEIYDILMERVRGRDYQINSINTELTKINMLLRNVDPDKRREISEWLYALMLHHEKLESNGSFKKVAYGPKVAGTGNLKILTYPIQQIPPILQVILVLFVQEVTK